MTVTLILRLNKSRFSEKEISTFEHSAKLTYDFHDQLPKLFGKQQNGSDDKPGLIMNLTFSMLNLTPF